MQYFSTSNTKSYVYLYTYYNEYTLEAIEKLIEIFLFYSYPHFICYILIILFYLTHFSQIPFFLPGIWRDIEYDALRDIMIKTKTQLPKTSKRNKTGLPLGIIKKFEQINRTPLGIIKRFEQK